MAKTKHPIQPIEADEHGRMRFKENKIISDAVAEERIDLNAIARRGYSDEDRAQLSMLIGYSVSGFGELSHVPRDLVALVDEHALYPTEKPVELTLQDRVTYLEDELTRLREHIAETAVEALVTAEDEKDIRIAVTNLAADALSVHPSHVDEHVSEVRYDRGLL